MKKMITMMAVAVMMAACDEARYEIRIDKNCSDEEVEEIREGFERINDFYFPLMGEEAVEEGDRVTVDYESQFSVASNNDNKKVVACFHKSAESVEEYVERKYGKGNFTIWGNSGEGTDVSLIVYNMPKDKNDGVSGVFLHVVVHELGHFVGIGPHAKDKNSAMNKHGLAENYTQEDADNLCKYLGCDPNDYVPPTEN